MLYFPPYRIKKQQEIGAYNARARNAPPPGSISVKIRAAPVRNVKSHAGEHYQIKPPASQYILAKWHILLRSGGWLYNHQISVSPTREMSANKQFTALKQNSGKTNRDCVLWAPQHWIQRYCLLVYWCYCCFITVLCCFPLHGITERIILNLLNLRHSNTMFSDSAFLYASFALFCWNVKKYMADKVLIFQRARY